MSSHGVPHEARHSEDDMAKKVGLLAALMAIGLTMVTIASHRTHTHSIVARAHANDQWSYYQSKKIKSHNLELGLDLVEVQALKGEGVDRMTRRYAEEKVRYDAEARDIQAKAESLEHESHHAEAQALRFDLAEGLFEIALVMSSLYFLAHRKIFPAVGVLGGIAGAVLGVLGLLV